MTTQERKRYGAIWGRVQAAIRKVRPGITAKELEAIRRPQHAAADCPESSKDWTPADLNRWELYAEQHSAEPDLARTMYLIERTHPEANRIGRIRICLKQLGNKPVSYAAGCARKFPNLPPQLTDWPAEALQAACIALSHDLRRAQLPGKP